MDWQQLQSLYNQKQSVERTGTLAPETIMPKNASIPNGKKPRRIVWTFLVILAVLLVAVLAFIGYKKFFLRGTHGGAVATTEVTQQELRQQMIDEIVQSSRENQIPPETMHAILSGQR